MHKMALPNTKNKEEITTMRKVVNDPRLTPEREKGYIALYEALVPDNKLLEINIPMIYDEAFKTFELTNGVNQQEIELIKAHFGIAGTKKKVGEARISVLIKKLRTFENAAHYVSGYKKLIENVASKMIGAPTKTPEIVKAKLLIMYFLFFCQSYFFPDEFTVTIQGKPAINKLAVDKKRNASLYPEYLFTMYINLIDRHAKKSMVYDLVVHELDMLDSRLQSEILSFVELKKVGKNFVSINKACSDASFANARRLKQLVNPIPMVIEADKLADIKNIRLFRFQPMYEIYKLLKTKPLETFPKVKVEKVFLEKHNVVVKTMEVFEIIKDFEVSSKTEVERIVFMFECVAKKGWTMKAKEVTTGNAEPQDFDCLYGCHLAAFKFAKVEGYLSDDESLEREFEVANAMIERANNKTWLGYLKGSISHEELKNILNIDKMFEEEVLGIKTPETSLETVVRFARAERYLREDEEADEELIQQVIVANYEKDIKRFATGEINSESFKNKIGLSEKFAPMYFDRKKVEIIDIEGKLLELKKNRVGNAQMQKYALLIRLYCYIVQNNVKCGQKKRAPKGNKSLKPQNLLAMIDK